MGGFIERGTCLKFWLMGKGLIREGDLWLIREGQLYCISQSNSSYMTFNPIVVGQSDTSFLVGGK